MKISLVIPCYNEKNNLPLLFERFRKLNNPDLYEIIIVDNGSVDGSGAIINELLPYYPQCKAIRVQINQGYGYGILQGLYAASGEIIGWTHADLQTDPCDVIAAQKLFEDNGLDIFVKGKRYGRPLADNIFTFGMSIFEILILRTCLWDINAQPTLFNRNMLTQLSNPPFDFSLDLYFYYAAKRLRKKIIRFPVYFGKRAHGHSSWNINWREKLKFIKRTVSFSLNLKRSLNSGNNPS